MLMRTEGDAPERPARVLIYSHDTFGLGHIRRCRAIAMALAEAYPGSSILIVTGSPIVGRFDFPDGVDFVRVPGVVKLPSGDYVTHNMGLDITETVALRRDLILSAAQIFKPDMLIVDKEPCGFRGELLPTLKALRESGAHTVLGVRDVLDEPVVLAQEWERKNACEALENYYDSIWIYGLKQIYQPLQGLPLSAEAMARVRYTGYLRREPADWPHPALPVERPDRYVLVTPGGGGDGERLIDWTLGAYESDARLATPAVIVFGPFMNAERRRDFELRAHRLKHIETMSFDSRLERLMLDAQGVIAMGGYNTFCEILSFDKPAAIAPRITPRREQYIRARETERIGLCRMLPPEDEPGGRDPVTMAAAIRRLADQPPPSEARIDGLLGGLENVVSLARDAIEDVRA